ncbi:acyl carrier protein [Streptomyces brevispora]|uniref:Acyl carrier protein n=1 Tax=Streptomyces brevispora TaxID=887462 RepID=A0A561UX01_9ACTN|nr:acyl carrier protein [Streptomyces brevispora]TWG03882.1 acyl carrier protein [Streptomyces brevispora]WSC15086.1 acyl carrier protein [Streptomyces brevispora]
MSVPMQDQITDIICEHFGIDRAEITPSTTFEDLDMDSLALAETVVVLEDRYGLQFPEIEGSFSPDVTLAQAADALSLLLTAVPAAS